MFFLKQNSLELDPILYFFLPIYLSPDAKEEMSAGLESIAVSAQTHTEKRVYVNYLAFLLLVCVLHV